MSYHCMDREGLEMGVKIKNSCLSMHLYGQTRGWNGVSTTCHFQGRKERGLNPRRHHYKLFWPFLVIRVDARLVLPLKMLMCLQVP